MQHTKRILILGGLGFIGKNLYLLLSKTYHVSILAESLDTTNDGFLTPEVKTKVVFGSILDNTLLERVLPQFDVIIALAGSSGTTDSIENPFHNQQVNLVGHLHILEACRKYNSEALLIFPSTRLVYGKPQSNPVSESHPHKPESIYAIHKLTSEYYYKLYHQLYGIKSVVFRIANPYGPYQKFGDHKYGILNWFIYKAIHKQPIELYGDGEQQRDFIYVSDLVELFACAIENGSLVGKNYNVGSGTGISLREAAESIKAIIPSANIVYKPWPTLDKKIESGDYISDITAITKDAGWQPTTAFQQGMQQTIAFYDRKK